MSVGKQTGPHRVHILLPTCTQCVPLFFLDTHGNTTCRENSHFGSHRKYTELETGWEDLNLRLRRTITPGNNRLLPGVIVRLRRSLVQLP